MYYALKMPDINMIAIDGSDEQLCVAQNVADQRFPNVSFVHQRDSDAYLKDHMTAGVQTILLEPSEADVERYLYLNPIIINN